MTIGSGEHDEILENFEKNFKGMRFEKETQELQKKGQVYQCGETNKLYKAFIMGYSFGRVSYLNN